jgi:hypothetical protein
MNYFEPKRRRLFSAVFLSFTHLRRTARNAAQPCGGRLIAVRSTWERVTPVAQPAGYSSCSTNTPITRSTSST